MRIILARYQWSSKIFDPIFASVKKTSLHSVPWGEYCPRHVPYCRVLHVTWYIGCHFRFPDIWKEGNLHLIRWQKHKKVFGYKVVWTTRILFPTWYRESAHRRINIQFRWTTMTSKIIIIIYIMMTAAEVKWTCYDIKEHNSFYHNYKLYCYH